MIGAYLVDRITQKTWRGTSDEWGTVSTKLDITRRGFINYKNESVRDINGEIVVSSARILLPRLTIIRDNFDTRAKNTIAYEDLLFFDAADHAIIAIGRVRSFAIYGLEVWVA